VRTDSDALDGKAVLREFTLAFGPDDWERIHLLVVLPKSSATVGDGKHPIFLGLNFCGNHALLNDPQIRITATHVAKREGGDEHGIPTAESRGSQTTTWDIANTIAKGYGIATAYYGDFLPDAAEPAKHRLAAFAARVGVAPDASNAPGAIAVWAWGLMRCVDFLATDPAVDAARIAVVGHSRNGKAALLAAALDPRIALAIPSQAGCGGTAPSRVRADLAVLQANGRPTAETPAMITKNFPHWFCKKFVETAADPSQLPVDQHSLVALCAPRPVLFSNATDDLWANPEGQNDIRTLAAPVYSLLLNESCVSRNLPPVGDLQPTVLGYFIRPGKHAMTPLDWTAWLKYANAMFKTR
jgi:hypothetical protein